MSEPEMKPRISYTLNLFADYHQYYLQDEQAQADTPVSRSPEKMVIPLTVTQQESVYIK